MRLAPAGDDRGRMTRRRGRAFGHKRIAQLPKPGRCFLTVRLFDCWRLSHDAGGPASNRARTVRRMDQGADFWLRGWRSRRNAADYHAFTERFPFYRDLGVQLAAAADVGAGAVVADLGCGTGLTTVAIAELTAPGGRVIGVDDSD